MVEVSKDEFYATVGGLDVVVNIRADGSDFEFRDRTLVGRIVGIDGHYWDANRKYLIVKNN